jgi:hypothetical protein
VSPGHTRTGAMIGAREPITVSWPTCDCAPRGRPATQTAGHLRLAVRRHPTCLLARGACADVRWYCHAGLGCRPCLRDQDMRRTTRSAARPRPRSASVHTHPAALVGQRLLGGDGSAIVAGDRSACCPRPWQWSEPLAGELK